MSEEVVITVDSVSKSFKRPSDRGNSVKSFVTSLTSTISGKKRSERFALHDVSFQIKKGEFFGIVGRNGSGKSTMLKLLAEIYQPTNGKVHVVGKLVPFIELGVGFNPELTGRENVYLSGALSGFSTAEMDKMYDDIVSFAELELFMDEKLKNYSSGMQVRLAFSVATRVQADILLIDEVLAVGDADFQRKCFDYFRSLKRNKKTVVFVSHDMEAIREYCDRAILIDESNLVAEGSAEKIAKKYSKLFIDDAHMAVISESREQLRWGSGEIVTDEAKAYVQEDSIVIEQKIKAKKGIVNAPVVGLRIRSASGESITGTNTKLEHIVIDRLKKDETRVCRWVIPNIFADGTYFIDTAVNAPDGVTVYDWIDAAAELIIKKKRTLPYHIDLDIGVTVSRD